VALREHGVGLLRNSGQADDVLGYSVIYGIFHDSLHICQGRRVVSGGRRSIQLSYGDKKDFPSIVTRPGMKASTPRADSPLTRRPVWRDSGLCRSARSASIRCS
jgi:hypothetical protein